MSFMEQRGGEQSTPQLNQERKPLIKELVLSGVFVILAAAVGYYFFWYRAPETFTDSITRARALCYEGKCEESVGELEKLLSLASSPREEGTAKTSLAFSYLDTDIEKAILLLKEIAADTSYVNARRAYAVEKMADIFMLSGQYRGSPLSSLIFSGDPYASFLSGDPRENMPEAMRRLYGYAAEFSPRQVSEYRIAEWYAGQAYYAKFDPQRLTNKVPLDEYIVAVADRLQKGDAAATATQIRFGELDSGYARWLRGYVMDLMADITGEDRYQEEAKNSFHQSLQILKQYHGPSTNYWKSQLLWMSFYYASFLAKQPDVENQATMDELIGYLIDPEARTTRPSKTAGESDLKFGLMQYLERFDKITATRSHIGYQGVLLLAEKEPRFAELLKNLGWDL